MENEIHQRLENQYCRLPNLAAERFYCFALGSRVNLTFLLETTRYGPLNDSPAVTFFLFVTVKLTELKNMCDLGGFPY